MSDKEIAFSVVIPVYNAAAYLPECLDSLLQEDRRDFELVMVDDGSQDDSGQLLEQYATRDDRVRVLTQKNGGVSAARNAGMEAARGEWLCFVDADDKVSPSWLQALIAGSKSKGDMVLFSEKLAADKLPDPIGCAAAALGAPVNGLEGAAMPQVFSKLYRKSFCESEKLHFCKDLANGEDMLFNLRCLLGGAQVQAFQTSFYQFRKNMASSTNRANTKILATNQLFYGELEGILRDMHSESWLALWLKDFSHLNGLYTCLYHLTGKSDLSAGQKRKLMAEVLAQENHRSSLIRRRVYAGEIAAPRRIALGMLHRGWLLPAQAYVAAMKLAKGFRYRRGDTFALV